MFPEISFGGATFIDMSSIVGPDVAVRGATIGLGIHHTAGRTLLPNATVAEEVNHIKAINLQHLGQGFWCGLGYNAICFASGRVYVVGRCAGQRAHVAQRNHELAGIALAGSFQDAEVPPGCIEGAARWVRAMWAEYGAGLTVAGHREWAILSSPTDCPGDGGIAALDEIVRKAMESNMAMTNVQIEDAFLNLYAVLYGSTAPNWAAIQPIVDELRAKHPHGLVEALKAVMDRLDAL